MPRPLRIAPAGICFHVLNRGNNRQALFRKEADYAAFITILAEAVGRFDVELFCWCLMPNHWHLVLRPGTDSALSRFMAWLTITHSRRHHGHYPSFSGHLYQGRYKSFPVQDDGYFLTLCRYVECNPLRAELVDRAEVWRWSSLHHSKRSPAMESDTPVLSPWPVDRPANWTRVVNAPLQEGAQARVELSLKRDSPLGSDRWVKQQAARLKLTQTLNPPGRPRRAVQSLSKRQQQRRAKEMRQNGR